MPQPRVLLTWLASILLMLGYLYFARPAGAGKVTPLVGLSKCEGKSPLAIGAADAALARGFNLPNWSPTYQGFKPDDSLLIQLFREGFTHIRLPIDAELVMPAFASPDQTVAYLDQLDKTVKRLHAIGYALSIDMHPGPQFQTLHTSIPAEGLDQLKAAWTAIAKRAENWAGNGIYFELLNEPAPSQEIWWPQAQSLVKHLNVVAEGRRLIVGPALYQRYEPLLASDALEGQGIVYAIHYYDPMVFTHQAMTWDSNSFLSRIRQIPFPADASHPDLRKQIDNLKAQGDEEAAEELAFAYKDPWTAERIASDLLPVGEWAQKNKVAVIINEFGVLDFGVDKWARIDWLKAVAKGAEAACLGWTHWEFSDGFGMVDPRTTLPDPFVLDALLPHP